MLRPFGSLPYVFEVSDTYGKDPFPDEITISRKNEDIIVKIVQEMIF